MRKSKIYLLNDEEFIELVKNSKNYSECLEKLGFNANGKRWIKEYNI